VRRAAATAATVALALAGCGEERRTLEIEPIERGIAAGVERDQPNTDVVAVDCPDDVELRKGDVFQCTVRGSRQGEVQIATVTQADDEGRVYYTVP
jgi:ribonuclease PH